MIETKSISIFRQCRCCCRFFVPSSAHRDCPRCRAKLKKNRCKDCGQNCYFRSTYCKLCSKKRDRNNRWSGGKYINNTGYVCVRVSGGYELEHRLVMESHIGRKLIEGENVHHINGVKDDNRIENLELWTRPQPSGVRAKDAIAWAEEIIMLYGNIRDII